MMETKPKKAVACSKHRYVPKTFELCPTSYPYFIPVKAKSGSIGYDLVCPVDFHVPAHSRVAIPINFAINLPFGVEAKIEARSGMTLRGMEGYGTRVRWGRKWGFIPWKEVESGKLNFDADVMPGKIDPGFTDSINVILKNNDVAFTIKAGTRIAQMTFYSTIAPFFEIVTQLSCKSRGGGLGSSGSEATSEAVRQAVLRGGSAADGDLYHKYRTEMRERGLAILSYPDWLSQRGSKGNGNEPDTDDSGRTAQQPESKGKDNALRAEYRQYRKLVQEAGLTPLPYYQWVEGRKRGEQPEVKGVPFDEWFNGLSPERQEEVRQSVLYKIMRGTKDEVQSSENE